MNLTDVFIRRPVLALVISGLLLMLGAQGMNQLALRYFPELEAGVIYVRTIYPGASAGTIQGFVTDPLQRRIAAANGVEYMTSRSDPGLSTIEVHVRLGEPHRGAPARLSEAQESVGELGGGCVDVGRALGERRVGRSRRTLPEGTLEALQGGVEAREARFRGLCREGHGGAQGFPRRGEARHRFSGRGLSRS